MEPNLFYFDNSKGAKGYKMDKFLDTLKVFIQGGFSPKRCKGVSIFKKRVIPRSNFKNYLFIYIYEFI